MSFGGSKWRLEGPSALNGGAEALIVALEICRPEREWENDPDLHLSEKTYPELEPHLLSSDVDPQQSLTILTKYYDLAWSVSLSAMTLTAQTRSR